MSTAIGLIRKSRNKKIWQKCCGFIDFNVDEFVETHGHLLPEQLLGWRITRWRFLLPTPVAGIPDASKAKISDPFSTTEGNDGMGLSMAYGIITGHSGNIDVESSIGWGATPYIRLPLGGEKMKKGSSSI